MTVYLLDASALIAAAILEHEAHERVALWLATVDHVAVCPITEGALARFLLRMGETHATATALLRQLHTRGKVEFWPDSLSYVDTDLSGIIGHRQVTDAYLAALAASRDGIVATLDKGLHQLRPDRTILVPG